jgi:hypothetical protein
MDPMQAAVHSSARAPCPKCGDMVPVNHPFPLSAYERTATCGKCGAGFEWWDLLHSAMEMPFFALAPIGAHQAFTVVNLSPGKSTAIDFELLGIPKSARILDVFYTPQGGSLFPARITGNSAARELRLTHKEVLFPVQLTPEAEQTETPLAVMALYVDASHDDQSMHSLVQAFAMLQQGLHVDAIIPANVAVELKLGKLFHEFFSRTSKADDVRSFLTQGATYGHQLNILLPSLATLIGAPVLPQSLSKKLHRLKNVRNEIGHTGKPKSELEAKDVSELVCAAAYGARYIDLISERLASR